MYPVFPYRTALKVGGALHFTNLHMMIGTQATDLFAVFLEDVGHVVVIVPTSNILASCHRPQ